MTEPLPLHVRDQIEAASRDVSRAFHDATPAINTPSWTQIRDGLYVMCVHIADEGPQPTVVRWAKRSALCLTCDDAANLLPDVVPVDECERCGARPITRFVEVTYQAGPVIFGTNLCVPCNAQVLAGEPALLDDPHPRSNA